MRYIYTLLLALLLGGIAAQAQEAGYQPLVREGVRWVFEYVNSEMELYPSYNMEFCGDTVIANTAYKKCYCYLEPELDTDICTPVAFVREQDKKVFAILNKERDFSDYLYEVQRVPALESDEALSPDEFLIYDFNDMSAFFDELGGSYQQQIILVGDEPSNGYVSMNGPIKVIEGVGADASGNLLYPIAPPEIRQLNCPCPYSNGFIKLTDLNGNILYRSSRSSEFSDPYCDVNHDGRVDIADVNAVINAMLGQQ